MRNEGTPPLHEIYLLVSDGKAFEHNNLFRQPVGKPFRINKSGTVGK